MCQLFETLKVQDRQIQNAAYHNARFNQTRKELFGINDIISLEDVIEIPDHCDDKVYKCRVIYSKEILKIEFELYKPKTINSLKIIEVRDFDYRYKYYDRSGIEELFKLRGKCDDILVIRNGFVTDTSYANIVFCDGNNWVTPSTPLLPGTQRNRLLSEQKIVEREIKSDDLQLFKKAKIINALNGLGQSNEINRFEY
ncbi:MAG: aminotransferase class IV [Bacteroidales bacterium]